MANQEETPFNEIKESYETHLHEAFIRPPTVGANVNVMMKTMSYFSHDLSKEEKSFFLNSLEKYEIGILPLIAITSILKAWIIRFKEEYLMNQTFFEPYPKELTDGAQFGIRKAYNT